MYRNIVIKVTKNTELEIEIDTKQLKFGLFYDWVRGDGAWIGISIPTISVSFGVWFKNGPSWK